MKKLILSSIICVLLTACADTPPATRAHKSNTSTATVVTQNKAKKTSHLSLQKSNYSALPGWNNDSLTNIKAAFNKSCTRILKNNATKAFSALPNAGTYAQWQTACNALQNIPSSNGAALRAFFETYFQPYAITDSGKAEGLFTGYYEASLQGSRTPSARYRHPLYKRPKDLVMVQLGNFREELKGQRLAGRVINGHLRPYETRAQIVNGQWPHNDHALVWVDNAIDAFFVQIQGSGVISLENEDVMRVGYAGQNGHPYYAIGRELITRGALTKETVSMETIRAWLESNPDQADKIMNTNKSYVFFEEKAQSATGAEGVVLTPERSLAIDHSKLPYGAPIWLDAQAPNNMARTTGKNRIQRLMITQDTGGAIRGAVRGDVYWGYGAHAQNMASDMKSSGRYWILLPK